jgi:hypothetical protein
LLELFRFFPSIKIEILKRKNCQVNSSNKFIKFYLQTNISESDVPPTKWQRELKLILLRALNRNQILILSQIENNRTETISSLLRIISKFYNIPLSTLKFNANILKKLNLISFGNSSNFQLARLTEFGNFLGKAIGSWNNLINAKLKTSNENKQDSVSVEGNYSKNKFYLAGRL